eukprot:1061935-Amorphochlora_amoeboformis.AAC.1
MFVDNVQHGEGVFTSETGRKVTNTRNHFARSILQMLQNRNTHQITKTSKGTLQFDIHVYDHGRVVKVTMGEVEDSGSGSVSGSGSGPGNSNDSKGQEL